MAKVKARRKRRGKISSFFRPIFEAEPALLDLASNADLIKRWTDANPRHTERDLKRVKQNLANLKSQMRKKNQDKGGKGKKAAGAARATNAVHGGRPTMGRLEEYIDECLTIAKTLDRTGLGDVIELLHEARNEVVWKMGH